MKNIMISKFKKFDTWLNSTYLRYINEKNSLIVFMFHSLFKNEYERELNHIDGSLAVTVNQFETFVKYFLEQDYKFVSPVEILKGLREDKKHILITFDDGYFNNINALPILESYDIPALVFISVNHVKNNKSFWWDVLYREEIKKGKNQKYIFSLQNSLKSKTNKEIEEVIQNMYGKDALKPISDVDRPFTSTELREFSNNKNIYIGNHTLDHAILTNYSLDQINNQIFGAQSELQEITGYLPTCIAYPNGNYSSYISNMCKDGGLRLGFTTESHKNYFPIKNKFNLGRFSLDTNLDIKLQCEQIRSDLRIYSRVRKIFK